MIFNSSTIRSCFAGLVGTRQIVDENFVPLDSDLTDSSSGLYVDDHPLISAEKIQYVAPNFEKINSPNTEAENFNTWYRERINDTMTDMLNYVYTKKAINEKIKPVLQDIRVYNGSGNFNDLISNEGAFVGFEVDLSPHIGLQAVLDRIGTQFNQAQDITIYLFQSSQEQALATQFIDKTQANSSEWTIANSDFILDYDSNDHDAGGRFYIGYFQDDLGGAQAIRKKVCWGCDRYSKIYRKQYSKYMGITPIKVPAGKLNGTNYWGDIYAPSYTDFNFGLNFSLSVECELSSFICRHTGVLSQTLQKALQVKFLREIAYSVRDTGIEEKLRTSALWELDKDNPGGALGQYEKLIKALSFDFSGLNSVCVPCERRGIRIGAI